jgi:ABC-type sugar transport system substrate-binding protein
MKRLTGALLGAVFLAGAATPAGAEEDYTIGLSWNAMDNQLPV